MPTKMQTGGSTVFPLFGFFLLESSEQMPYIVKMEPIPLCIIKVTGSITDSSSGFGQGRKWGAVKKFGVGPPSTQNTPPGCICGVLDCRAEALIPSGP